MWGNPTKSSKKLLELRDTFIIQDCQIKKSKILINQLKKVIKHKMSLTIVTETINI